MTTVEERLAVLEHKVDAMAADVREVCAAVLGLRLHEARMEPFERGIWIILGVVLAAIGSGLLYILRSGVVPAAR